MAVKQGVTKELKRQYQLEWMGLINNIRVSVEEIVLINIEYISADLQF